MEQKILSNSSRCSTRRCCINKRVWACMRLRDSPAVGTEKPGNQQHQCPDNQRIEQNEPDTVTLHQRYIQNDALALRTVRVHTEKLQLFVIEQQLAPKVLLLPMRRVTCPSKYLQPAGRRQKHPLPGTASYTHRTPFVIARFWLVNTGPSTSRKERESIWEQ